MNRELRTVREVSRGFGISARMLRYYEAEGLLTARRMEGYAYRVYDEAALLRLRQILLLRRLRIPLRQIKKVLDDPAAKTALEVFEQNIREMEGEIHSLSAVRDVLRHLAQKLERAVGYRCRRCFWRERPWFRRFPWLLSAIT